MSSTIPGSGSTKSLKLPDERNQDHEHDDDPEDHQPEHERRRTGAPPHADVPLHQPDDRLEHEGEEQRQEERHQRLADVDERPRERDDRRDEQHRADGEVDAQRPRRLRGRRRVREACLRHVRNVLGGPDGSGHGAIGSQGDRPAPRATIEYVGHATVLVDLAGVRLLTDPLLRNRVAHLRRAGKVDAGALRGVDAVLISHLHYDHLDLPSLAEARARHARRRSARSRHADPPQDRGENVVELRAGRGDRDRRGHGPRDRGGARHGPASVRRPRRSLSAT